MMSLFKSSRHVCFLLSKIDLCISIFISFLCCILSFLIFNNENDVISFFSFFDIPFEWQTLASIQNSLTDSEELSYLKYFLIIISITFVVLSIIFYNLFKNEKNAPAHYKTRYVVLGFLFGGLLIKISSVIYACFKPDIYFDNICKNFKKNIVFNRFSTLFFYILSTLILVDFLYIIEDKFSVIYLIWSITILLSFFLVSFFKLHKKTNWVVWTLIAYIFANGVFEILTTNFISELLIICSAVLIVDIFNRINYGRVFSIKLKSSTNIYRTITDMSAMLGNGYITNADLINFIKMFKEPNSKQIN